MSKAPKDSKPSPKATTPIKTLDVTTEEAANVKGGRASVHQAHGGIKANARHGGGNK